jgi:polysaccharide chain length determinant protein (PEP-CTERM system associated)
MDEIVEEQESARPDIQRYLDIVRRRHIYFLVPLLIGWLTVWGASWILPARYKSGTLILVEEPTMPKNYVVPNVSDNLQDRLQSITQQILSRTRLLLIIDKLHLYEDIHRQLTPDQKVDLMRTDIDIELIRDAQNAQITAFRIYYSSQNPHVAQEVTSELTGLFIDDNLRVRQQQSEDTTNFIRNQLSNASAGLAEQEAKVRAYKSTHEGDLPSQEASNLQILSGLQAQLQNEQDTLNTAKQQRVYLQTLIEQYQSLHVSPRPTDAGPTGLEEIERNLELQKSKLVDLSSRYTDHYPAVEALRSEIAKTEKERDEFISQSQKSGGNKKQLDGGLTGSNIGIASPQTPQTLQLQSQLQANQEEIANRERAITQLETRVNNYQARLDAAPASEQQLADLTRGYDQSKANYDDLLKKQNESEMATSMEQMQQGQRFSILDPPSFPLKPDSPNRLKFCGIGLGIGLALGLLVVGVLEFIDDRLHSETEIKTLLSTTVLVEIPEIVDSTDERSGRRRMALGWAMAALVLTTILAGSAFSYLHN